MSYPSSVAKALRDREDTIDYSSLPQLVELVTFKNLNGAKLQVGHTRELLQIVQPGCEIHNGLFISGRILKQIVHPPFRKGDKIHAYNDLAQPMLLRAKTIHTCNEMQLQCRALPRLMTSTRRFQWSECVETAKTSYFHDCDRCTLVATQVKPLFHVPQIGFLSNAIALTKEIQVAELHRNHKKMRTRSALQHILPATLHPQPVSEPYLIDWIR